MSVGWTIVCHRLSLPLRRSSASDSAYRAYVGWFKLPRLDAMAVTLNPQPVERSAALRSTADGGSSLINWWCLQKRTAVDPWPAVLPGRTQAGCLHLPRRGGRGGEGTGRRRGRGRPHGGEGLCRLGRQRDRLARATVAKTMLRMTRPARRPPYLQLDRVGPDQYRGSGCVPGVSYPASWTLQGQH